jgi:hypothetical protein
MMMQGMRPAAVPEDPDENAADIEDGDRVDEEEEDEDDDDDTNGGNDDSN